MRCLSSKFCNVSGIRYVIDTLITRMSTVPYKLQLPAPRSSLDAQRAVSLAALRLWIARTTETTHALCWQVPTSHAAASHAADARCRSSLLLIVFVRARSCASDRVPDARPHHPVMWCARGWCVRPQVLSTSYTDAPSATSPNLTSPCELRAGPEPHIERKARSSDDRRAGPAMRL